MALDLDRMAVLKTYNNLFIDEDLKDVTFRLQDGEERAHRNILMAASEVFKGMFKFDMKENQEGVVELPDLDRTSMRVFLRLIYTGHVDPTDWMTHPGCGASDGKAADPVLWKANTSVEWPRLTALAPSWKSSVMLDAESDSFQFTVKSDNWQNSNLMIGIVPKGAEIGNVLYNSTGFWLHASGGSFTYTYPGSNPLPQPIPLRPNASVTVKYDKVKSTFMYSLDGNHFTPVTFRFPIPGNCTFCPAVNFYAANETVEIEMETEKLPCPLGVLLAVTKLARKYMVRGTLSMTTQVLKRRLMDFKAKEDIESFQEIFAAAIGADIGALRLAALDLSRTFIKFREQYDEERLRPEVAHELEAIWPVPGGGDTPKRLSLQTLG
eukprot:TRINITY_DN30141_c0_g1_i1.p1 TRINITY_DN30141_c0_g1~~TRINITY_DN30141_c0_g1_i1.p1  ORF type:complete len:380 (-),score=70.23 TRINITY_DN30141_c0_g1_i1:359-1498(-)